MSNSGEPRGIMVVCGTRPEAIKMAPLILALQRQSSIKVSLCSTGQHREMLARVWDLFKLTPDFDLDIMQPGQDLTDVTTSILKALRELFKGYKPDRILVHGDTNTTLSASLAAYYAGIPVSHVEAGLRTYDLYSPWPEEANRKITSVIADKHYAPTASARDNLLREAVPESRIVITGNTVVDALLLIVKRLEDNVDYRASVAAQFDFLDPSKKLVLVTGHRRENFGEGFVSICKALLKLGERSDVQIVYPVHLNPNVQKPVNDYLANSPSINLIKPLDYVPFVYLMTRCHHIISDSGGVQEEAPSLGKPVLVMRDTTERPEALDAGTVLLVGTSHDSIVTESTRLLDDEAHYKSMSIASNPYGDGRACQIICEDLTK